MKDETWEGGDKYNDLGTVDKDEDTRKERNPKSANKKNLRLISHNKGEIVENKD